MLQTPLVQETMQFDLSHGIWYVRVLNDYFRMMSGQVLDASQADYQELSVSPSWESCEVSNGK